MCAVCKDARVFTTALTMALAKTKPQLILRKSNKIQANERCFAVVSVIVDVVI